MEAARPAERDLAAAADRRGAADAEVRPNGPVAAALLATGIGALVLAILVVAAEASESFANSLAYSDRVGPLAGKTIWAVVAFFASWLGLSVVLRTRSVGLGRIAIVAAILIALALIGTFAPFFQLFAPD
jgi:hypothetical protein